ncbi:MAG: guanylate kinase [Anaerovoracaceae bacterium]|jgi:guanylate kinase
MISNQTGKLFVISGPSGTGKGTICAQLLRDLEGEGLGLSVSMTTREPREGEVDGESYFFKTREEFLEEVRQGGLLEYAETYGNYYGTPRGYVEDQLRSGHDVLLEIEMQGALQVKRAMPGAVMIFILPPSLEELRRRIIGRGTEDEATIELRMSQVQNEISYIKYYDYFVINDDLDEAVHRVEEILHAEKSRITEEIAMQFIK